MPGCRVPSDTIVRVRCYFRKKILIPTKFIAKLPQTNQIRLMALSAHQPGSASTPSTLGTHPGAVSALSIGRTGYSVLSMYQYHSKVTDPALDGIKWNDWKIKHGPTPVVANWYPEDSVQCSLKTHSSQSKHQQKCKEPPIATTSCPFGTYQKHQIFSRGVAPNMPKCFHFSSQQLQQQLLTNVRLPRTSRSGV